MKSFCCLWLSLLAWVSPLFGISILETTEFPSVCQKAAVDKKLFENFKQDPVYQAVVESVSNEMGKQYLDIICQEYPELISLFDQFRQNDAIGNPSLHDYGDYGLFSPTTLRYIKMAGDLKHRFGDLSQMHIVEIGKGSATLCKILSDMGGFASYTFVDLPQCNALTKRCLQRLNVNNVLYVDKWKLEPLQKYDLVISNYSFSESDLGEQNRYLEKIISSTERGYLTMNFINSYFGMNALTSEEMVSFLYGHGRKGKVEKERPNSHPYNLLITWENPTPSHLPGAIKERPKLTPSSTSQSGNAITYALNGGRLGDNLMAYFHGRWLSYKSGLPFLFLPFPFSDQFKLHEMDPLLNNSFSFEKIISVASEDQIQKTPSSFLYQVPYFPECRFEEGVNYLFSLNWEDPEFKAEVLQCLTPVNPVETLFLPKDCITVGVHVRRGSGSDLPGYLYALPLKFPPLSYYVDQIERLSKIFKNQSLYVHVFTDSSNPGEIVANFRKALNNSNITFSYSKEHNDPDKQMLVDFFSIPKFDCLIIPQSNFSLIHTKLKEFAIVIAPLHSIRNGNNSVIDEVELTFNALCSIPFDSREKQKIVRREEVKKMTTSVVVPCCAKHFKHLEGLLESYLHQTVLPDEIVISLSDAEKVKKEEIEKLKTKDWMFHLKIISSDGKKSAGENRNIAIEASSGDIILGQDADDLPHPQRIEIVKYMFENFDIDHLIHQWVDSESKFGSLNWEDLELIRCDLYEEAERIGYIHNGQCCYTREVAKYVKWPIHFHDGEDVEFNRRVYAFFENKAVLKAPLIAYRSNLSTFNPKNNLLKLKRLQYLSL